MCKKNFIVSSEGPWADYDAEDESEAIEMYSENFRIPSRYCSAVERVPQNTMETSAQPLTTQGQHAEADTSAIA